MPEVLREIKISQPEPDLHIVSPEEEAPIATATVYNLGSAAVYRSRVNGYDPEQSQPGENVGYMMHDGCNNLAVEQNAENSHLFSLDEKTGQQKLIYQHSATIVQMLEIYKALRENNPEPNRPEQNGLAFFDKNGTFYNHVHIKELNPDTYGKESEPGMDKHTVIFESFQGGDRSQFSIAIDNMYCLNRSPHPFVREGDDS